MANLKQIPLTCSGHTRPVVHLDFSDIVECGYFLISACKGTFLLKFCYSIYLWHFIFHLIQDLYILLFTLLLELYTNCVCKVIIKKIMFFILSRVSAYLDLNEIHFIEIIILLYTS